MFRALLNQPFKELRLDYQLLVYFSVIGIAVLITYLFNKFLKNKSEKFIYITIFIILIIGLITHFVKPFFPPYTTMDHVWKKLTFENICAVSILTFPLIYLSKSDTLKDYMVIFGIISGIVSFIAPVVILEHKVFTFEFLRFYLVHFVIFLAPYLMAKNGVHKISILRVNRVPLVLLGVLFIIFINELVITALGWVPYEELFDPSKRNPSIIYGLGSLPEGLPDFLAPLTVLLTVFTPNFLMNVSFLPNGSYFPVLWMVGPVFVYGISLSVLVLLYFEPEETKAYFRSIMGSKEILKEE